MYLVLLKICCKNISEINKIQQNYIFKYVCFVRGGKSGFSVVGGGYSVIAFRFQRIYFDLSRGLIPRYSHFFPRLSSTDWYP